ncbi:MAG: hypothetical protein D8M59_08220 [Planctomycetes bacterium]|nr:hypothetical protein [Planctomycetota bacterium]NOG53308.1 M48 family metalloprotease [Planctomycetota bacterium]
MLNLILDWLLTYLLHSTVALGLVWALSVTLLRRREALADMEQALWKTALVGSLVTASAVGLYRDRAAVPGPWLRAHSDPATAFPTIGDLAQPSDIPLDPSQSHAHDAGAFLTLDFLPQDPASSSSEPATAHRERAATHGMPVGGQHSEAGMSEIPADDSAFSAAVGDADADVSAAPMMTKPSADGVLGSIIALIRQLPPAALPAALFGICLLAGLIRLLCDCAALRCALHARSRLCNGEPRALLDELLADARVPRTIHLSSCDRLTVPLALSWPTSEICLPDRVLHDMTRPVRRAVLAHELAHLARHDPVWQTITRVLQCLLFFQPLNFVARRRIQTLSEQLADRQAMQWLGSGLDLADGLTEVARWLSSRGRSMWRGPRVSPLAAAMVQERSRGHSASDLHQRIHRLLCGHSDGGCLSARCNRRMMIGKFVAGAGLLVALMAILPGLSTSATTSTVDDSLSRHDSTPLEGGIISGGHDRTGEESGTAGNPTIDRLREELDALDSELSALRQAMTELSIGIGGDDPAAAVLPGDVDPELQQRVQETIAVIAARIDHLESVRDEVRDQAAVLGVQLADVTDLAAERSRSLSQ